MADRARLDDVAWVVRVDIRHKLQALHSEALELRACMPHGELYVDNALKDVDRMLATLQGIRRQLAGRKPGTPRGPAGTIG